MPPSTDRGGSGDVADWQRARNAALAGVPFAVAVGTIAAGVVDLVPTALVVGAGCAGVAEILATRHATVVRGVWERTVVQVAATATALLGIVAGVRWLERGAGSTLVSLAVGGLGAYLLALAAVGYVVDG